MCYYQEVHLLRGLHLNDLIRHPIEINYYHALDINVPQDRARRGVAGCVWDGRGKIHHTCSCPAHTSFTICSPVCHAPNFTSIHLIPNRTSTTLSSQPTIYNLPKLNIVCCPNNSIAQLPKRKTPHQRPADGVFNATRPMFLRVNFPQLLEANTITLWLGFGSQVKLTHDLLWQVPVATFSEDSDTRMELHASLEWVLHRQQQSPL